MPLPRDFERAYESLVELVGRISGGEVREEVLGEEVDAFLREACRGSSALAEAALLALRYELASEGLAEDPESIAGGMQTLGRIEAILKPPTEVGQPEGDPPGIVEVALSEEFRRQRPAARGFRMGELKIIFEPSQGPPYGALSVSHPRRLPTYEELLRAREAPGDKVPNLWAWLPKPDQSPGMQPNVVHLYVMPPEELLG